MEMDRTRLQNAADIHSKSGHALDPWWQESEEETQGDVEEISRAGDEGSRVELGPSDEACNGQATLAFIGVVHMCDHTRRGLSVKCYIRSFQFIFSALRLLVVERVSTCQYNMLKIPFVLFSQTAGTIILLYWCRRQFDLSHHGRLSNLSYYTSRARQSHWTP